MSGLAVRKKSTRAIVLPWKKLCQHTLLLLSAVFCGLGKPASTPVDFEAAAIHKSAVAAGTPRSLGYMPILGVTGSSLELRNYALVQWIAYAYDVPEFQISGPDWISREKYDLSAKLPQGSKKRDAPAMLQSLLAARFGFRIHRETRQMSGYALVVGKAGAHVKPSLSFVIGSETEQFSELSSPKSDRIKFVFKNCTMPRFAQLLSKNIREAVVDATNLAGTYDIPFEFSPRDLVPNLVADGGLGPTVIDSVERLGLKLEHRKVAVDMVLVDNISRPTEN